MRLVNKVLAGIAGSVLALSASASLAADIQIPVPPMSPPVVVTPPPAPGFDWRGPYVGGLATLEVFQDPDLVVQFRAVAGQVGFNLVRGSFLVGPVLRAGLFVGPNVFAATLSGRAGVLLGAEDRILVYGAAGVGYVPDTNSVFYTAGGGLELGIGERFSVFTETRALIVPGLGAVSALITAGANFHF